MYTTNEINLEFFEWFNQNQLLQNKSVLTNSKYYDISNYIKHPYWNNLKSITDQFVTDESRYFQMNSWNQALGNNESYEAKDLSFELILVRRPLYVMINLIYINFILNIVILLAFHMPFVVQISAVAYLGV